MTNSPVLMAYRLALPSSAYEEKVRFGAEIGIAQRLVGGGGGGGKENERKNSSLNGFR